MTDYDTVGEYLDDNCDKEGKNLVCDTGEKTRVLEPLGSDIRDTDFSEENVETIIKHKTEAEI